MSARSTASPIAHGATRLPRATRFVLDAHLLTPAAHSLAQVLQLVGDDVVDRLPGVIHIVANLLGHVLERDAIHHLGAFLTRRAPSALGVGSGPAGALHGASTRPSRSGKAGRAADAGTSAGELEHRTNRPAAGRAAAEKQCDSSADRGADDGGRQQ